MSGVASPPPATNGRMLGSLPYYDAMRRGALPTNFNLTTTSVRREGNLDVLTVEDGDAAEEVRICHIVDFNRHSFPVESVDEDGDPTTQQAPLPLSIALLRAAAVALALDHLNTGNGAVISEVGGLDGWCDIKFTTELFDTAGVETHAVVQVAEVLSRTTTNSSIRVGAATTATSVTDGGEVEELQVSQEGQQPCAFLGAWRSEVTAPLALLTSDFGYPQLSPLSLSEKLDDVELFPLLATMRPSTSHLARILVDLLDSELHLTHIAALYTDDSYGVSYVSALREAAANRGIIMQDVGFPSGAENMTLTVQALKDTGYKFFVGIVITAAEHVRLMEEAYRQGIAGSGEYNWVFTKYIGYDINSSPIMRKASTGVLDFYALPSIPGAGRYDVLIEELKALRNADDLEYLQSKLPSNNGRLSFESPIYSAQTFEDANEDTDTALYSGLALFYDAVVALGLGACSARNVSMAAAASPSQAQSPLLNAGEMHFHSTLASNFLGASGSVRFEPLSGSRDGPSALYILNNYVPDTARDSFVGSETSVDDKRGSSQDSTSNLTRVPVKHYVDGWVTLEPILYSNGKDQTPLSLPPQEVNMNYLGSVLRAIGLTLCGLILALSIACASWTHYYQEHRIVRSSQPIFLHAVCAGVFLAGSSIIALSFDDEAATRGSTGAGAACMAVPWLLHFGWVTAFGSLFVKMRRVVKIFHSPRLRRVTVQAKDVVMPMVLLLAINSTLLAIWTVFAVPSDDMWVRTPVAYDGFGRLSESHGKCNWSNGQPSILILLLVIDLLTLVITIQQAWVVRRLSLEFAESKWIARAMCMMLLISFVGIPLLVITNGDPSAVFFASTAIVFVSCMSLLTCIFFPKMSYQYHMRNEHLQQPMPSYLHNDVEPSDNGNRRSNGTRRSWYSARFHHLKPSGNRVLQAENSSSSSAEGAIVVNHPGTSEYFEAKIDMMEIEIRMLKAERAELQRRTQDEENNLNLDPVEVASSSSAETTAQTESNLQMLKSNGDVEST